MRLLSILIVSFSLGCVTKAHDFERVCASTDLLREPLPADRIAAQKELRRRIHARAWHPRVRSMLASWGAPDVDVAQYAPMLRAEAREVGVASCPLADEWEARYPNPRDPK